MADISEITTANFESDVVACRNAIISHDWATAADYYAGAQAIHAGLLASATDGDQAFQRVQSLEALKTAIDFAEGRASRGSDRRRLVQHSTRWGT